MIGSGEAESRAIASAVRGAVAQSRLDAGVNIAGLLVDLDVAVAADSDSRQLFMCWHLTRVLGPSLTEMLPPPTVRRVVSHGTETMASPHRQRESGASSAPTTMQLHDLSEWRHLAEDRVVKDWAVMVADGCRCGPVGDPRGLLDGVS